MLTKEAEIAYGRPSLPIAEKGTDNSPNKFLAVNLPPDYEALTEKGKRLARLNGVRLHGPDPVLFLRAWTLFDTYYLRQLPDGVFYKDMMKPSRYHSASVLDLAKYQLNAWAYPRGAGKSTLLGKGIPLFMSLARSSFDVLLILAKDAFVTKRFSSLMAMYEDNKFIVDDFGAMKPPRGAKVWNHSLLQLANGSSVTGMPVEGKMLGERPDLILPDDPEHDKTMVSNPNPESLRQAFERLLFGTVMPMLRLGSCLGWIGTLLDAQSFLSHVMYSTDKRFAYWNRRVYGAFLADGSLFWEEWRNKEDLERLREMWGDEYFQTHMMNRPGAAGAGFLKVHDKFCTYSVEDIDEGYQHKPLASTAKLVATRPVKTANPEVFEKEPSVRGFGSAVEGMFRFMTIDWAFTTGETSDFSCIHVFGYENGNVFKDTLWSLDMWLGKAAAATVTDIALKMAIKWRVRVIGSEAIGSQMGLTERLAYDWERLYGDIGWKPAVIPLRNTTVSKDERIAGVQWRFDAFKIKLPIHKRNAWPYKELWYQIENFAVGKRRIPHDDALDTIAMCASIARPLSAGAKVGPGESRCPALDRIKAGELVDENTGLPWAGAIGEKEWPEALKTFRKRDWEETEANSQVKWEHSGAI